MPLQTCNQPWPMAVAQPRKRRRSSEGEDRREDGKLVLPLQPKAAWATPMAVVWSWLKTVRRRWDATGVRGQRKVS